MQRANISDVHKLANMLKAMYQEISPLASNEDKKYEQLAEKHIKEDYVYLLDDKAFYIVKDVSVPVIDRKMWDGVSVYIKPEYRKGRALSSMYKHMFKTFDGDIIGMVEPNSEHLPVVAKRHTLVGYLYKMNRS